MGIEARRDRAEQIAEAAGCPVCGLAPLPLDSTQCPQCDADLLCFAVLDALPTSPAMREPDGPATPAGEIAREAADLPPRADRARESRRALLLAGLAAIAIAFGLAGALAWVRLFGLERHLLRLEELSRRQRLRLAQLERSIVPPLERRSVCRTEPGEGIGITGKERRGRILVVRNQGATQPVISRASLVTGGKPFAALGQPASSAATLPAAASAGKPGPPAAARRDGQPAAGRRGFWVYRAREGDTLWELAKRHYGAGAYYRVLLAHNPRLRVRGVGDGVQIRLLHDLRRVAATYRRIVGQGSSR